MFQVQVSDPFSFHKPQRDLKACQEDANWIGKTLDQSEAQDGFEDDATPSTRCTSSSFQSLKSPPRWIDRTFHWCGMASRLMAMVMSAFFVAFLIYLHLDVSRTGASVGARVKFSFVRCWPSAFNLYGRCDTQIHLGLIGVGGISHSNIIALPVMENITGSRTGRFEGEYFVGVQFESVSNALDFEKVLLGISEDDLLKQAAHNFKQWKYGPTRLEGIDVRRTCTSADVVEEQPPNPDSITDADQKKLAEAHMVKVPRCMYDL